MKETLIIFVIVFFPIITLGQITINGTYSQAYEQNIKKNKLYYTEIGIPFSKNRFVRIGKENKYKIKLKKDNTYKNVIFSTDYNVKPEKNWCKISTPLNLSKLTTGSIALLHDIVIDEECETRGHSQDFNEKNHRFANSYTVEGSIYKLVRLDKYGDAFIEFYKSDSNFMNTEIGRWYVDRENKQILIKISAQKNLEIGLYLKVNKEYFLNYEELDNNSIILTE